MAYLTDKLADSNPSSDDLIYSVNDPAGTPADRKVTLGNAITKAHGLSDGIVKVASGTMAVATGGTDYANASHTHTAADVTDLASATVTFTNKTFDANGTGNSLSNVEVADLAATAVVTAAEGLASSDNDTSIPTTAAVIDGLDTKQPLDADLTTIAGLTATTDNFIQAKSSAWASRTPTQVTADLINFVGDSGSGGTKGLVPAPAAGDAAAGKYLKSDGTWATVTASGGGDNSYDAVVAASGGDYTTLSDALAAASAGWRILVRDSETLSGNVTSSLTNLEIVGDSRRGVVIAIGANILTFSGAGVTLRNIGFSQTTGRITLSGANIQVRDCYFNWTSNSNTYNKLQITGDGVHVANCEFLCTGASSNNVAHIAVGGAGVMMTNNYFNITDLNSGSVTTRAFYRATGANPSAIGNTFVLTTPTNDSYVLAATGGAANWNCQNNTIISTVSAIRVNSIWSAGAGSNMSNNVIRTYSGIGVYSGASQQTISNNIIEFSSAASSFAVYNDTGNNAIINGNMVYNNGSADGYGIYLAVGDDHVITNNRVSAFGTGIQLGASTMDRCVIADNSVHNCTTPITDSGTGTLIKDNQGASALLEKNVLRMKNTSGSTMNVGDVVVYKSVAAGDEVTTTTTAGDDKVFGVCLYSTTTNSYGYFQTLGKTTTLKVNGTTDIAIGDFLTTYTSAGIAAKATTGDMVFAIALEAYIGDDSNGVIDALLISPRLI